MTEQELQHVTGLNPDAWSIARARLLHMLSIDEHGLYFSPRLDREKFEWSQKQEKSQEKARNAANTRWKRARERKAKEDQNSNKTDAPSIPQAVPEQCPSPSPVNNLSPSASLQGKERDGSADLAAPVDGFGEDVAKVNKNGAGGPTARPHIHKATQPFPVASQASHGSKHHTLQAHVKANGNGKKAPAPDRRFSEFKDHIMRYYSAATGDPAEATPWGLPADRALVERLRAEPHLSVEVLARRLMHRLDAVRICLEHPRRKGNVNPRDEISVVLGNKFPLYTDRPVDAFGEPL